MPRLVSLICLFLIAVLRLVGGATSTPIIQIHDDPFDSRVDVAQEAVNTGCGAAFIPDLGVREQNAALALHLEREVLSPSHCSLLAIYMQCRTEGFAPPGLAIRKDHAPTGQPQPLPRCRTFPLPAPTPPLTLRNPPLPAVCS